MVDHNRLLLEMEQTRRTVNRGTINPEIKTLCKAEVQPVVEMIAHARAAYVSELFRLAQETGGKRPPENVDELRRLRKDFEELVDAANALETMIKRGYVDVKGHLS